MVAEAAAAVAVNNALLCTRRERERRERPHNMCNVVECGKRGGWKELKTCDLGLNLQKHEERKGREKHRTSFFSEEDTPAAVAVALLRSGALSFTTRQAGPCANAVASVDTAASRLSSQQPAPLALKAHTTTNIASPNTATLTSHEPLTERAATAQDTHLAALSQLKSCMYSSLSRTQHVQVNCV